MFLILNLLLVVFPLIVQCDRLKGAAPAIGSDRFLYLYDDLATSSPVIEYKTTQQQKHQSSSVLSSSSVVNNTVLFNETDRGVLEYQPSTDPFEYRIIQFYDSNPLQCLDCELFKDHYVKLATRLNEIVNSLPEELPFKFKISTFAVSCPHYPDICRVQEVNNNKVPIVRLYPPGSQTTGHGIHYQSIHPYYVLERMGISSLIQQNSAVPTTPELEEHWNIGTSIGQKRKHIDKNSKSSLSSSSSPKSLSSNDKNPLEVEYDVNKVIDNFLQNYVHHQSIGSHELNEISQWRLKEFLILLDRTLPQNWKVHVVLREMLERFSDIVNDRNRLVELLQQMKGDGRFIVKTEWSPYCSEHNERFSTFVDSDPEQEYSEYSCGFWELLQSVAVGLVDYNQVAIDANERISSHRVMDIVQNTLQTFNSAGLDSYTRSSLLYMYNTCGFNACNRIVYLPNGGTEQDWIQMSLWFNEMQNYINIQLLKRLANHNKRILSFQEEIDAQSPTLQECPTCWITRKGVTSEIVELKNNDMIFKYLKYHYGRQNDNKLIESLKSEISAPATTSRIIVTSSISSPNATSPVPFTYNESDHYFTASTTTVTTTFHHQGASTMVFLALLGMVVRVGMNNSSAQQKLSKKHASVSNLYDVDAYMHDKQA